MSLDPAMAERAKDDDGFACFVQNLQSRNEERVSVMQEIADYSQHLSSHSKKAILSSVPSNYANNSAGNILNNICYAIAHDATFILDTSDIAMPRGEKMLYRKLYSLIHYVPTAEELLWIDMDAGFARTDMDIFRVMSEFPKAKLILADHSLNINAGVLFFRNSAWARSFLNEWLKLFYKHPEIYWEDQGMLWMKILDHYKDLVAQGDIEHADLCGGSDTCMVDGMRDSPDIQICTVRVMKCLGYTFNSRISNSEIEILPQNEKRYRFNQWRFGNSHPYGDHGFIGEHGTQKWVYSDYYEPGDLIVHSKGTGDVIAPDHIANQCGNIPLSKWRMIMDQLKTSRNPEARSFMDVTTKKCFSGSG